MEYADEAQQGPPKLIHPQKLRNILSMWSKGIRAILQQGMLPRVLISIKIESHLEKKIQLNITYPGLTAKQALPLLGMAAQAVKAKAEREEIVEGPQIIVPT